MGFHLANDIHLSVTLILQGNEATSGCQGFIWFTPNPQADVIYLYLTELQKENVAAVISVSRNVMSSLSPVVRSGGPSDGPRRMKTLQSISMATLRCCHRLEKLLWCSVALWTTRWSWSKLMKIGQKEISQAWGRFTCNVYVCIVV